MLLNGRRVALACEPADSLLELTLLVLDLPGAGGVELACSGIDAGQAPAGGAGLIGRVVDLGAHAILE